MGAPGIREYPTYSGNSVEPVHFGSAYPYGDDTIWLPLIAWKSQVHAFVWFWPYLGKVARYTADQGYWTLDKIPTQPKTRGVWDCPENVPGFLGYSYCYNEYLSERRWLGRYPQQDSIDEAARVYMMAEDLADHGVGQNYLMVDGHVQFVQLGEMPPTWNYGF
jgi:prepilin-type processing-associated H-X9-DG protein